MSEYDLILQLATSSHVVRVIQFLKTVDSELEPILDLTRTTISIVEDNLILFQNVSGFIKKFVNWHRSSILYRQTRRMYWLEENNQASSIDDLMTQLIPTVQSVKSIRIISYPRSLEKVIAERLPLDIELDPRNSSHVLAVVRIGEEFRFGLTEREVNFFESSTEPKLSTCFVSSAVCKLNEAFQRFQLMDTRFESVVDLGAAPGGWTQYLSQKAKVVYSVDGANLAPEVLQLKNVLHIKSNATNSIQSLKQQWLDGNAALNFTVDLIVSDMNVTPLTLIEILKSFVPLLKTNGRVLATLKFIGTTMDRQSQLESIESMLNNIQLTNIKFLWLFANTRSERMLMATKPCFSAMKTK